MICPNCGVDTETFEQEQEFERKKARKREEFERLHGKKFRRLAWRNGLFGSVIGILFLGCLCFIYGYFSPAPSENVVKWPWDIFRQPPFGMVLWLFMYAIYGAIGFVGGWTVAFKKKSKSLCKALNIS